MQSIVTRNRLVRRAILSSSLAAALIGASMVAGGSLTTSTAGGSISVGGHAVSRVLLDGHLVSLSAYQAAVTAEESRGRALHLVVDRSAVARGYFVAFRSTAAANAYLKAHRLGVIPGSVRNSRAQVVRASQATTINGRAIDLATCTLPSYYAFFYVNSSCGGSYLSMVNSDQIPHFSTYGFNDVVSSLAVGCKISNVTVWKDASYSGSTTSFGGFDVYTGMPSGWNDVISSAKTDSSFAC
jgi:hypothetical protein